LFRIFPRTQSMVKDFCIGAWFADVVAYGKGRSLI